MQPSGAQVLTTVMAALIIWLAASVLFGSHGAAHLMTLHAQHRALGETTLALRARNQELEQAIERLRVDDSYLERIARSDLGLVRPDEIVYRFHRPPRSEAP